ncbi:ABC transporter ATP-binding protein [Nocardioides seonyuensis]|uniref:ABC transporter ATP-binding protein n=1 Tax=Nocardioides seonyuensis TaxID=2518371 RepID=UPI001FC9D4E1|nr:ABC transporter ATP-binding protein [Nocardioides seonyuensis]
MSTSAFAVPARGNNKGLRALRSVGVAWRRLSPFFRGSRRHIMLLVALAVSAGLVEASVLALVATIAVALSTGGGEVALHVGPLAADLSQSGALAVAFGLTLVRAALQLALAYLPGRMSSQVMADLRVDLFSAFTNSAWSVKAQEGGGAFQTLMTQNVTYVALAVISLANGVTATIMFTIMIAAALAQSFVAASLMAIGAFVLFFTLRPLSRLLRRFAKRLSRAAMRFTESVQDIIAVAEETEVFGATESYVAAFHDQVDAVRRPYARTRFLSAAMPALYQSVALVMLVLALTAVALAEVGNLAGLAAVILLLVRALTYAQQMQAAITSIDERLPFMHQILDALDRYRRNPQQDGTRDLDTVASLSVEDVSFGYRADTEVLQDVSFGVSRGEAIGIVGPSGAGKSSVVQLILRLREPSSGRVLVNGQDVREIKRSAWRKKVAYVPQSSQLVRGTVRDNIRFYREWLDDEQVERAARRAHIHEEIMSWPEGYDTMIGQRAISGGQRQRVCLARALADEPEVMVLDEPTSALDVRSEEAVRQSLHEVKEDTILVLIAHRLSTLSMCDRIVVMVDGRVSAVGSHADLVEKNDFFREVNEITHRQVAQ